MPAPPPVSVVPVGEKFPLKFRHPWGSLSFQRRRDGGAPPSVDGSDLEVKVRDLLQREVDKIRQEFKSLLEAERTERFSVGGRSCFS